MSLFRSLLLVIGYVTQRELSRQVRYLIEENALHRSRLPERIVTTPKERQRLLTFGSKLGRAAINRLVTIVAQETFLRWICEDKRSRSKHKLSKPSKRGRPRTQDEIRTLIVFLARENSWGYDRIVGELRKFPANGQIDLDWTGSLICARRYSSSVRHFIFGQPPVHIPHNL